MYTNEEISETEIRKQKNICYSNKRNKLPRNKFKQGNKRSVRIKLQNTEDIKENTINGSMYHVHGLQELTSSKFPYYPKQFIDSMQSLLKYQWHIQNKYFKSLYGTINDPE